MELPIVAIVGAPNVGKSTLFNRILGRRQAIVTDEPGMTRDRLYGTVDDASQPFRIVDTGGLTPGADAPFASEIAHQAEIALNQAELVLFVVDARAGITAFEHDLAQMLRRRGRPWILVANKCDHDALAAAAAGLHALGLGTPWPVSAEHGLGIEELLVEVEQRLAAGSGSHETAPSDTEDGRLSLVLVGRPNVGKSSIFNRLAGEERAMVSDVPGTTRDAVDTWIDLGPRRYRLIDTAGLRRPGKATEKPERFSVAHARENLERADVAVLVLDAEAGIVAQDAHIAGHAQDAYKPLVVAVNKWDLVAEREEAAKRWEEEVRRRLRFFRQVPLVFVSARSGQRVLKILDLADAVHAAAGLRVATPQLTRWLRDQTGGDPAAPPPPGSFRLYYATQTGVHPPAFTLFCNDPARAHFSTRRRLQNALRDRFGFGSVPIRLRFRGRSARGRRQPA